jgi:putative resolvase
MGRYVKLDIAKSYYNVSSATLRRWARDAQIDYKATNGGHYRYYIDEYDDPDTIISSGEYIIYARVSSAKQHQDLQRQISSLQAEFPKYKLVTDIGSGINYQRKGFQTILEQLFNRNIKEVVVAYPDRWSRLGFDLFQWIFEKFGAKLTYINQNNKTPQEELLSDVMEVFTVFSARYYGSRKYKSENNKTKNRT